MRYSNWPNWAASYLCNGCGLIPIWPCFASMIYDGVKKFEYRKRAPRENIVNFFIYETSPVSSITGVMAIKSTLIGSPEMIWKKTCNYSGVDEDAFISYYSGKSIAYALEIVTAKSFYSPINLCEVGLPVPQTIRYLL